MWNLTCLAQFASVLGVVVIIQFIACVLLAYFGVKPQLSVILLCSICSNRAKQVHFVLKPSNYLNLLLI